MTKESRQNRGAGDSVHSWWKWAFIGLLLVNIGVIVWFGSLFIPRSQTTQPTHQAGSVQTDESYASLEIKTSKEEAEKIIKHYISKELDADQLDIDLRLEDEAIVTGQAKWLVFSIPFEWRFDVYAMEDGNIQLRSNSSKIGQMKVPASTLYGQMSKNLPIENLVTFDDSNDQLVIHLSDYSPAKKLKVLAEHIDLKNDQLEFSVHLFK